MTTEQIILALDAACCAAEIHAARVHPDIATALSLLQDTLDEHFDVSDAPFGEFLAAQRDAVTLLARNPAVFGAHELN